MTKVTVYLKIWGDSGNLPINGGCETTMSTSHCPSGSYPRGDSSDDYERCYFWAGVVAGHNRKCFNKNGKVKVQHNDDKNVYEVVDLTSVFKNADTKQIIDMGSYNYYLAATYNNLTTDKIKSDLTGEIGTNRVGYNDRTPFEQALAGSNSPKSSVISSTPNGYCKDSAHIGDIVYGNYTCRNISNSDVFNSSINLNTKKLEKEYCDDNPWDPNCACYNVHVQNVESFCSSHATYPGCKEYLRNKIPLDTAGITGSFQGGAACLAPDACNTTGVYIPEPPPNTSCDIQLEYCNMLVNTGQLINSTSEIKQTCNQKIGDDTGGDPGGDPDDPNYGKPGLIYIWNNLKISYKIGIIVALSLIILLIFSL